MKYYKLTPEAAKYFQDDMATRKHPLEYWLKSKVKRSSLQEVKTNYITPGIGQQNQYYKLSEFSSDKGTEYHFTVHFDNTDLTQGTKLVNDENIKSLINKFEKHLDEYRLECLNKISQK